MNINIDYNEIMRQRGNKGMNVLIPAMYRQRPTGPVEVPPAHVRPTGGLPRGTTRRGQ